jgi:hypothetical protein
MSKRVVSILLLAAALCARPALAAENVAKAAQNVANTSQKGSLLIFPLISIDPEVSGDTFLAVSNDQTSPVHVECSYINEAKGRVDFNFTLMGKATAGWDAFFGDGIGAPPFPIDGKFTPSNPNRGELICFAVDAGDANQIAFNHLTGTATVVAFNDTDASQRLQAFRYNAWRFVARSSAGLPEADNVIQGKPGDLRLTGGGAGTYDACPLYNFSNFSPNGATDASGLITTQDNDLSVVSCNQDLRQDFLPHLTKLQFTVWNANAKSFTGSYQCVDSVQTVPLSSTENSLLVAPLNFEFATLRTRIARFQVSGVASTNCPNSETTGLLGLLTSSIDISPNTSEDAELGTTTQGAGLQPGFVFWDPAGPVLAVKKK